MKRTLQTGWECPQVMQLRLGLQTGQVQPAIPVRWRDAVCDRGAEAIAFVDAVLNLSVDVGRDVDSFVECAQDV